MAGRRITIEFLGKDVSAGKTADQVSGKFGNLSSRFERVGSAAGKLLAGGLFAGGAAMVKFGNQASDLAETQSKVNQIFGAEGAAALDKFASGAAKAMGQSKQTALDGAATFGIIGKSAGLAGSELVGFSTDMTSLAGDMASFNNTSPEDAITAIGAAMRGEQEPIRRYGVLLDDATLRNSALRLGLIKTTKQALTPQQKALAAQAEIMRQTKDQQGDFARTSDGLANKQRILKAQFENVTTQLGTKALPIMVKVSDWALKAIKWTQEHSTATKVLAGTVVGLAGGLWLASKAISGVTTAMKVWKGIMIVARNVQLAFNLAMMANPIGLVVLALVALATGLVFAYKKSETFRKIVDGAFKAVGNAISFLWNRVAKPAFSFLIKGWLNVANWIIQGAAKAFGWVPGLGPKLRTAAAKFEDFKRSVNNKLDGIKPAEIKVKDGEARRKVNSFREFFLTQIGQMKQRANIQVGVSGGVGGLLGQTAGRRRATGGRIQPNQVYSWNENGREAFMSTSPGVMATAQTTRAMVGADFTVTAPLVLQVDSRNVWQGLLKVKRDRGGVSLGLA